MEQELVTEQYSGWHIDGKASADWALDKIREAMEAKACNNAIAEDILAKKKEEVDKWLAEENDKLDNTIAFFKSHLYAWTSKELETINAGRKKPVQSIALPAGKVGFKKQNDKFLCGGKTCSKDNKELLKILKESNSEFIHTETVETVAWADFKKTVTVTEDGRVISADGEVLNIQVVQGEYEFVLPKFKGDL